MGRSPGAKKYDKKKKLKKAKLKRKLKKVPIVDTSEQKEPVSESTEEVKREKRKKSIEYLRSWKKHREDWKFNKIVQVYILRNWLRDESLKDKYFEWFCEYCKGLPSRKKETLSSTAVQLMESSLASATLQSRARQLIQSPVIRSQLIQHL